VRWTARRVHGSGWRRKRPRCGAASIGWQGVKAVIGADPLSGRLFLFRSRSGNRLKILTWDRDGYVLWYKRLEVGVFKLPRVAPGAGSVELREAWATL
jgi:transposase